MNPNKKALITEVYYPETDGKPVAETEIQVDLLLELRATLKDYFAAEPDAYAAGNMLLYYVEGDPKKCVAPDVFFVRGVPNRRRRTYKVWEEGKAPDVVFEVSSRGTWGDDLKRKWKLYERLGVKEYFIFDPEYDYLVKSFGQTLLAYRLVEGKFTELDVIGGRVFSQELRLELVDTGETLRLFDPQAGRFLPTRSDIRDARQQAEVRAETAEARAEIEAEARRQAEAELERLRKELERLRSQ
jgi:Uma2 family endonuclease